MESHADSMSLSPEQMREMEEKSVIKNTHEEITTLGNTIGGHKAVALAAFLTVANLADAQTPQPDLAKNNMPETKTVTYTPPVKIDTSKTANFSDSVKVDTLKKTTDPIKDKKEYEAERDKLLKRWEQLKAENAELDKKNAELDKKNAELDKQRERIALKKKQLDKINGPLLVFDQMKADGRTITAQDIIWANGRIESFNRVERLPELKEMANKTIKILQYIASVGAQQAIVKNN